MYTPGNTFPYPLDYPVSGCRLEFEFSRGLISSLRGALKTPLPGYPLVALATLRA